LKKEGNMKKVLLATSALAMMAGAASAEIALSGSARMGLVYLDGDTHFNSRVRIVFTASGETDGGLSFGASMRADQIGGNGDTALGISNAYVNGDSTVFISGAFGKLTMGDVGGAADALVGQVSGVGYGPIDALQEIGFIGTNKTAVYYEYSTGGFTFGLGAGQINTDAIETLFPGTYGTSTGDTMNIAVKYATDAYSVALGYETFDADAAFLGTDVDALHLGGSATFGAATVKARVTDSDIAGADTMWALSVDYVTGATTITAFYTDFGNNTTTSPDTQHYGIGAAYDLGGGATLAGGIVQQNNSGGIADATFADLGLKFSF
jgi:outer membrane protein OmpU